jgi:MYXO-CTERM domain-containing protein
MQRRTARTISSLIVAAALSSVPAHTPLHAQTGGGDQGTTTNTDRDRGTDWGWLGLVGLVGLLGLRRRHDDVHDVRDTTVRATPRT